MFRHQLFMRLDGGLYIVLTWTSYFTQHVVGPSTILMSH